MDNSSLQKIKDILAKNEAIGIAVGFNPTIDEMGAALALYLSLLAQHKTVSIASASEPIVELSSLVGIDKVRSTLGGGGNATGDLVVSFPYNEGEIEKVSYTIDNGFLNIVVKAGEKGLTFAEQDVQFTRGGGGGSVNTLFVIGTPNLSDLGQIYNPESLKDATIINIDNKNENQGYGDVVLVSPRFSSVSEQVADMLYGLGVDVDVDAAQNLMSGISFATGNFQSPTTSSLAFEMAALLMRKGAIREPIRRQEPTSQLPQFTSRQQPQPMPQPHMQQQQPTQPMQPRQQVAQDPQEAIRQALRSVQSQQQAAGIGAAPQRQDARVQNFPSQAPQQQQPIQQPQRQNNAQPVSDQFDQKPPSDWLTPKVYKGSTTV